MLDKKGKIISYFGTFPDYINQEECIPNLVKSMFYQSMFTINRKEKKFASSSGHVLEIFDYNEKGSIPKSGKRIKFSSHDYFYTSTDDRLSAQATEKTEKGVSRIQSTQPYIYLLYDRNNRSKENTNSEIRIFNWEGDPLQKISLDKHIECFCVNTSDTLLYGSVYNPEISLASVDISNVPIP